MNCNQTNRQRTEQFSGTHGPAARRPSWLLAGLCMVLLSVQSGCQVLSTQQIGLQNPNLVTDSPLAPLDENGQAIPPGEAGAPMPPPSELAKVSLPTYRIEPPDVLLINAVRLVPKAPYQLASLDLLQIVVTGTAPTDPPIAGTYQVEPSGTVNLGPGYGSVKVEGLTVEEAHDAVTRQLRSRIPQPQVSVSILQTASVMQIANEHLVAQDGRVYLGVYGNVPVAGLTVEEARQAIEEHLSQYLDEPRIAVDVFAYNSKVYYVITQGATFGDQVARFPITGNETVLDAIAQIGGIGRLSSRRMWISRPSPQGVECDTILPIDWDAITSGARTSTNFQILPNDRLFIAQDRFVALDGTISKVLNPFERVFGFLLLGAQSTQTLQRFPEGRFGL